MEKEKKGRGGRREGAGRKSVGDPKTATITLRVTPAIKDELRRRAKSSNKTIADLLTDLLTH